MSTVVETSKTALEIYQPVIVGLGAVLLGFLSNGLLEWWKNARTRRIEVRDLKHALYFDISASVGTIQGAIETLRDGSVEYPKPVVVRLPQFLANCDRKEIGRLDQKQIGKLSEFLGLLEHLANLKSIREAHPGTFIIEAKAETEEAFVSVLTAIEAIASEALRVLKDG